MQLLITICARGGSKGIPRKNIKEINGVPLIGYSIQTATKLASLLGQTDIALSTDDAEIKNVSASLGLPSKYTRPAEFATDQAGKIDVIRDVLSYEEHRHKKKYDYILDLDVTSPLRNVEDLTQALKIIQDKTDCLNLFSVNPAHRNPYFNMVQQREDGFFELVKKGEFKTRQSAPKVFDMNASFYFYRRAFFDGGYQTVITDKSLVYIMPHTCFDIDSVIDYEFMSYLIQHQKLDFKL